jgi:hypothetical protein
MSVRPNHQEAFDRLVLKRLQPWNDRYAATASRTEQELFRLFSDKDCLNNNLVIWHHCGNDYCRWLVSFIRFVQLNMKVHAGNTFTWRIYVKPDSPLLPGNKDRKSFPYGDLWINGDPLIQIIQLVSSYDENPTLVPQYFGDSGRLYVVLNTSIAGFNPSLPSAASVALPKPKFQYDVKTILNYLAGITL